MTEPSATQPTADAVDPFDELDAALSVSRALSRRIAVAVERADATTIDRLSRQRGVATAEVDKWLRITSAVLAGTEIAGER